MQHFLRDEALKSLQKKWDPWVGAVSSELSDWLPDVSSKQRTNTEGCCLKPAALGCACRDPVPGFNRALGLTGTGSQTGSVGST